MASSSSSSTTVSVTTATTPTVPTRGAPDAVTHPKLQVARSLVPTQWQDTVRIIGMSEYREAALSLSHAFAADSLSLYLIPSEDEERDCGRSHSCGRGQSRARNRGPASAEDRWRLHVDIMTYFVAAVALNGIVTTIGPDYEGVALWLGPDQSIDGWWTTLRSGLWRLHLQLSPEGHRRYFDEVLPLLHQTKVEVMSGNGTGHSGRYVNGDNSYYLLYLGTKPSARGRGYAQKLLEHMFVKADEQQRPIYLESSSADNNRYYSRFGFEYKKYVALVRGQIPVGLSIMVREPQANKKLDDEHI